MTQQALVALFQIDNELDRDVQILSNTGRVEFQANNKLDQDAKAVAKAFIMRLSIYLNQFTR